MLSTYSQLELINNLLREIMGMLDDLGERADQGLSHFEMLGATGAAAAVADAIVDIQHILVSMEDRAQ